MYKKIILLLLLHVPFSFPVDYENRLQGCMLSAMLGDCLGRVTEHKKDLQTIFSIYPEGVRSYSDFVYNDWNMLPPFFNSKTIMPYTDDTGMALLVLKTLLATSLDKNKLISPESEMEQMHKTMAHLARYFVEDQRDRQFGWNAYYRPYGKACLAGTFKLRDRFNNLRGDCNKEMSMNIFAKDRLWDINALEAGGCGSVMRAYPCGMIFARDSEKAIEYAVTQSKLTHGAPIALAACAGIAAGVSAAIRGEQIETVITAIITAADKYDRNTAHKVRNAVVAASKNKIMLDSHGSVLKAFKDSAFRFEHERIFTTFPGWAADDALAGAVYCFCMSPETVLDAVYLGVHTPGDSDSIASLAGCLVGAHCGVDQIKSYIPHIEQGIAVFSMLHNFASLNNGVSS